MEEQTVSDLMEKYEVPKEYIDAMLDAYELGAKKYMLIMANKIQPGFHPNPTNLRERK